MLLLTSVFLDANNFIFNEDKWPSLLSEKQADERTTEGQAKIKGKNRCITKLFAKQ